MNIAIIDGLNQDIGLKILFPEADYFIKHSELDRTKSYSLYNFQPNTDWSNITDKNYNILFVVISLYDTLKQFDYFQQSVYDILQTVLQIIDNNNFKTVCFFDNYDYDYDPSVYLQNEKINFFFKRNYNKIKTYNDKVKPFPFIMFGEKSIIEKIDTELVSEQDYFKEKTNHVFFNGRLFVHFDRQYGIYRNRYEMYNKIKSFVFTNPFDLCYDDFINMMRQSKYSLDLLGVGEPNKRTFEILLSGALMISEYNELKWPFPEEFSELLFFKTVSEYFIVLSKIIDNNELYNTCLRQQYNIVKKYFNKEWLRNYIETIITV